MEWHHAYPSIGDKENMEDAEPSRFYDDDRAFEYFVELRLEAHDHRAAEKRADFFASLKSRPPSPTSDQTSHSKGLRDDRTRDLWEGLRRRFFGEMEPEPIFIEENHDRDLQDDLRDENHGLRGEISDLLERLRRRRVFVPLGLPPSTPGPDDTNPDGPPPDPPLMLSSQTPLPVIPPTLKQKESPGPRRSTRLKRGSEDVAFATRRKVKDRWYFEPALPAKDPTSGGEVFLPNRNVFATQHFSDLPTFEENYQKATKNASCELSSTNHNVSSSSCDPLGISLPVRSISHVERKLPEVYEEPPQDQNEFVWVGARTTLIS